MDIKNTRDAMKYSGSGVTKQVLWNTPDMLCFMLNLRPGQSVPPHQHGSSSLILTAMSGSGTVSVNSEAHAVSNGNAVFVKSGDSFGIPAVSEDFSAMVTLSPGPAEEAYSKNIDYPQSPCF